LPAVEALLPLAFVLASVALPLEKRARPPPMPIRETPATPEEPTIPLTNQLTRTAARLVERYAQPMQA
jgi:hypothetical protein